MQLVQSLRQTTQLAMTQRMQQSIRILQMNPLDLAGYLAEEALINPCLEVRLPEGYLPGGVGSGSGNTEFDMIGALASDKPSLYAHVAAQIDLSFASGAERRIAYAFLENLEPSGWLGGNVQDVARTCGCPHDVAEAVLHRLQRFDPAGLFARSLAECLRLQARDQDLLTWEVATLLDNLPLLAKGALRELADLCDCDPEDIPDIVAILRGFDPKPGQAFSADRPPVFPPDLSVRKNGPHWEVELNRSNLPAVTVSTEGAEIDARDSAARSFRLQALSKARWLAQAVENRHKTMLRTATAMVAHQTEFLEHGSGRLRPLSLDDIAADLNLHASTISRATSGRMIETPRGTFALKTFFSRSFPGENGPSEQSQDSVIALVRAIVADEDPARPLSDADIVKAAASAGQKLARRTVAKYRDVLGIASSFERRKRTAPGR